MDATTDFASVCVGRRLLPVSLPTALAGMQLGRRGTARPGKVALWFHPHVVTLTYL